MDVYLLHVDDDSAATTALEENGGITTIGMRGSSQPVENSYVYGELAYQWGTTTTDFEGVVPKGGGHQAWAANLGAEYTFADLASTPKIGGEWRYYSGKKLDVAAFGWRPIAPGLFTTAIREFQTRDVVTGFYRNAQAGVTSGQSNQHEFGLYGGFNPIEDLTVNSRVSFFLLDVGAVPPTSPAGPSKRNRYIGTEWDTQLTYDYTDDVQFGLLYALFLPGNVFRDAGGTDTRGSVIAGNATAQQIVSTVSLKF